MVLFLKTLKENSLNKINISQLPNNIAKAPKGTRPPD